MTTPYEQNRADLLARQKQLEQKLAADRAASGRPHQIHLHHDTLVELEEIHNKLAAL
jgi:hypothetical protein